MLRRRGHGLSKLSCWSLVVHGSGHLLLLNGRSTLVVFNRWSDFRGSWFGVVLWFD